MAMRKGEEERKRKRHKNNEKQRDKTEMVIGKKDRNSPSCGGGVEGGNGCLTPGRKKSTGPQCSGGKEGRVIRTGTEDLYLVVQEVGTCTWYPLL